MNVSDIGKADAKKADRTNKGKANIEEADRAYSEKANAKKAKDPGIVAKNSSTKNH